MRLAYATTDEVNQALATQMAAACGAVVCHIRPGEAPPSHSLFDAFIYDLDDVPSDQRRALLEELCLSPSARPTAVHGYGIADEQSEALRAGGCVIVAQAPQPRPVPQLVQGGSTEPRDRPPRRCPGGPDVG